MKIMSYDSQPVNMSVLHHLAHSGKIEDLRRILLSLPSDRLEALVANICYELQYIDIHQAAPFRSIMHVAIDINRVRRSDIAIERLMGGVV